MDYTTHVKYDRQTGLPEIFLRSCGPKNYQIISLNTSNGLNAAGEMFCEVFGVAANLASLIEHLNENPKISYAPKAVPA